MYTYDLGQTVRLVCSIVRWKEFVKGAQMVFSSLWVFRVHLCMILGLTSPTNHCALQEDCVNDALTIMEF